MSIPEMVFRGGQFIQKKADRSRMGWKPTVRLPHLPEPILPFEPTQTPTVTFSPEQPIFRYTTNINGPIDWHLDVSTGLRFPKTYAKDADVRSGRFGSAKYTWEINRLLFLPQLAVQYRQTGDQKFLNQFVAINRSWFAENPYLTGVNWYSNIEVNIRLINWFISWNILDASALAETNVDFRQFIEAELVPVIYQHCVYSRTNPSHYSSANNHLISEYSGLFVAASFWEFPESAAWRTFAKAGLEHEIVEQHSPNGVNREEAAEYIQFITDFFLIAQVVGDRTENPFSTTYTNSLRQVLHYIAQFLDCEGTFPRYGDEDDGRVLLLDDEHPHNNFRSLLRTGAVLFGEPLFKQKSASWGEVPRFDLKNYVLFGTDGQAAFDAVPTQKDLSGSKFYTDEGHFIIRKQEVSDNPNQLREIYIHADVAPLGYLSIAAHGHADALSFLMHIDGHVFLADPGTYSYQTDPQWRNYFISTRAHNTVCIDGQNQALQAGALLWLNHYKTWLLSAQSTDTLDQLKAVHNGYKQLECRHQRQFDFDRITDTLCLTDTIENSGEQTRLVEVMFHLGPDVQVEALAHNAFLLSLPGTSRQVCLTTDALLNAEAITGQLEPTPLGWYSNGFYQLQPSTTIRAYLHIAARQKVTLTHQLAVQDNLSINHLSQNYSQLSIRI
ncbi:alginate lyase family protein [Spirosoma sp.]|uniref:alginate lyase family protein n=1 Tax=Spirosoma sp. TaxID=1899569 RepID=UPI002635E033|nr:alginate lyase family protein [Spirosoma sp.]MCX6218955.1 alginate lyase family protein [Spirosoma sp.]